MPSTILILGGGVAGLAAAKNLVEQGHKVIILEARNRLGGRVDTMMLGDGKTVIERGANWIEAIGENPVLQHLRSEDADTRMTSHTSLSLFENGKPVRFSVDLLEFVEKMLVFINRKYSSPKELQNVSMAMVFSEFYKQTESEIDDYSEAQLKNVVRLVLNFDEAQDLEKISAAQFHEEFTSPGHAVSDLFGTDVYPEVVTNGYNKLVHSLQKQIMASKNAQIQMETRVARVDTSKEKPIVMCMQNGKEITFEADAIICALPLGVMQNLNKANAFVPALPAQSQQGLMTLDNGVYNKVILQFDKAFWPKTQYIGFSNQNEIAAIFNYNYFRPGSNTLIVMYVGERAKFSAPDADVIKQTLAELKGICGREMDSAKLVDSHVTRWHQDEFALGAYSSLPVGADPNARKQAATALPERKLFFAGEHIAHYPGTVHGAYISGDQAATALTATLAQTATATMSKK